MNSLAPICLFIYNRPNETKRILDNLAKNYLASESDLFIFSDGATLSTISKVFEVREIIKNVKGFKSVTVFESLINKGLANSIIQGASQIIDRYDKAIIVEDDLVLSSNFLAFMNQALINYKNIPEVFSISGYCLKIMKPSVYNCDSFFYGRAHSWGWGTWKDRWETVDWEVKDWNKIKRHLKKDFNTYGSDLFSMLSDYMTGKNNSWYIRFNLSQFKQNKYTVYPFESKVINAGFIEDATHCNTYNRNDVIFDKSNKTKFIFNDKIKIDPLIKKQLYRYKSIPFRIKGKVLTLLLKKGFLKQRKINLQ